MAEPVAALNVRPSGMASYLKTLSSFRGLLWLRLCRDALKLALIGLAPGVACAHDDGILLFWICYLWKGRGMNRGMKRGINPVTTELYFLPVETRVPFKFGHETLTSVACARVHMEAHR